MKKIFLLLLLSSNISIADDFQDARGLIDSFKEKVDEAVLSLSNRPGFSFKSTQPIVRKLDGALNVIKDIEKIPTSSTDTTAALADLKDIISDAKNCLSFGILELQQGACRGFMEISKLFADNYLIGMDIIRIRAETDQIRADTARLNEIADEFRNNTRMTRDRREALKQEVEEIRSR